MMKCPSCSAPLVSGEARCVSCHALVNPPVQGASALAPRLVTPQSLDGPSNSEPGNPSRKPSADDAWRREVLERVRKRRQVRTHALPLFVEGPLSSENETPPPPAAVGAPPAPTPPVRAQPPDDGLGEEIADRLENVDPRPSASSADLLSSLDGPLVEPSPDDVLDLQLRPVESENAALNSRGRGVESPSQSLVERPRPTLVPGPMATRSLVADLPLVEPSRTEAAPSELPPRVAPSTLNSRAASMPDRAQAAFIDLGLWSFLSATAFYFASRIARTSIAGLGPAWQGLALFGLVLAAAYILFFGGLSGATPGKIVCGIQVRRFDGSSLGPLASLARGLLGILGVALLGLGVWPAFWDKDRRALHDRATDSRVTTV